MENSSPSLQFPSSPLQEPLNLTRQLPTPIPPEDFDFDTDEIRSLASDDLYQHRPNRWRGSPDKWLQYTAEERTLVRSLDDLRRRDLGVHLYNAYALKRDQRRVGVQVY